MTAPNVNTLWGRVVIDELAKADTEAVCIAPGSRSTPLAVAAAEHDDLEPYSILDERSAAFLALGRAKRSGRPTPVICTSGTAAAEFHPAVIEADTSRTPMLLLTADRPPELHDSGANQTVDQIRLYGDAVRWYRSLPEPAAEDRTLRSLRTTVSRAVLASTGTNPGPVHLNVPFKKPLAPTPETGTVSADLGDRFPLAVRGRTGPFVETHVGTPALDDAAVSAVAETVAAADRGLVVAGPGGPDGLSPAAVASLAGATGFPVLADPLSGLRFGPHVDEAAVAGGYDAYLDTAASEAWPAPDLVVRFGAAPTSKALRHYLASTGSRQFVVDPAGGWREATFTTSDLVVADPDRFVRSLLARLDEERTGSRRDWADRFHRAERVHRELVRSTDALFEGAIAARTAALAPDPATLFVSSSMPVRDLDRFAAPASRALTVLGNRGASGVDGVTSAAIGAATAAAEPAVLLTGDLAFFHDLTGLLALDRCGADLTVVLVNNDGGGIFHQLPIAAFDPPFSELFVTPHGLAFEPVADLYGLGHTTVESIDGFEDAYAAALQTPGSHLVEVRTDARASFGVRDRLQADLVDQLG